MTFSRHPGDFNCFVPKRFDQRRSCGRIVNLTPFIGDCRANLVPWPGLKHPDAQVSQDPGALAAVCIGLCSLTPQPFR
jgi:hypothetical protein